MVPWDTCGGGVVYLQREQGARDCGQPAACNPP